MTKTVTPVTCACMPIDDIPLYDIYHNHIKLISTLLMVVIRHSFRTESPPLGLLETKTRDIRPYLSVLV